MAAITISVNTLWSAAGITAADDVTVNAGVTLTLDAIGACNSITVNGTLFVNRTGTNTITSTGAITFNNGAIYDAGTIASPQTGVHELSVTNANTDIVFNNGSEIMAYNATPRTRYTQLTSDTASGGGIINVADATNWSVGDTLTFEDNTVQGIANLFKTTISAITGLQVTLTNPAPRLLDGTTEPLIVHNCTDRITFTLNGGRVYVLRTSTASDNKFLMRGTVAVGGGYKSFKKYAAFWIEGAFGQGKKGAQAYGVVLDDCAVLDGYSALAAWRCEAHFNRCCASQTVKPANNATGMATLTVDTNTHVTGSISCMGYNRAMLLTAGGIHKGSFSLFNVVNSGTSQNAAELTSAAFSITSGIFRNNYTLFKPTNTATVTIRSGRFANNRTLVTQNGFGRIRLIDSVVPNPTVAYVDNKSLEADLQILNRNNDSTLQELHTRVGALIRDTTTAISPATKPASIRMEPSSTTDAVLYSTTATILAGTTLSISAQMQADAAYNGTTRPLIRISGQEFDVTQAMSAANGAWELVSLTSPIATNTHTVTVSVEAIGTAGAAWFDDLTIGGKVHDVGQDLFAGGTEISTVIDITDTLRHFTLTGLQPNTEVRVYRASDGVELAGVENSATSFDYAYNYTGDVPIYVNILNVQYEWMQINTTLTNSSTSIPIQQRFDRNYV